MFMLLFNYDVFSFILGKTTFALFYIEKMKAKNPLGLTCVFYNWNQWDGKCELLGGLFCLINNRL